MITYYSIWALFATHLQKDLGMGPVMVGAPLALANLIAFLAMGFWGWVGDVLGRRWSMIIPAAIGLLVTPTYLLTSDPTWIIGGFLLQSVFAGAMYSQMPSYLTERFPTEVRATASGFCFHQAAIFGGSVAPVLTYFAVNYELGFAIPMLIGTTCRADQRDCRTAAQPGDQGARLHVGSCGRPLTGRRMLGHPAVFVTCR